MNDFMNKYPNAKKGDRFEIVGNKSQHGFSIGDIVFYADISASITDGARFVNKTTGDKYYVLPVDVKPIQTFAQGDMVEVSDYEDFTIKSKGAFLFDASTNPNYEESWPFHVLINGGVKWFSYARPIQTKTVIVDDKTIELEEDSKLYKKLLKAMEAQS